MILYVSNILQDICNKFSCHCGCTFSFLARFVMTVVALSKCLLWILSIHFDTILLSLLSRDHSFSEHGMFTFICTFTVSVRQRLYQKQAKNITLCQTASKLMFIFNQRFNRCCKCMRILPTLGNEILLVLNDFFILFYTLYIEVRERKMCKCFLTYIHLNLFRSHTSIYTNIKYLYQIEINDTKQPY